MQKGTAHREDSAPRECWRTSPLREGRRGGTARCPQVAAFHGVLPLARSPACMFMQPGADAPARVLLSERLQTVTETLAAARTEDEVLAVVLTPALEALGATALAAIRAVNPLPQLRPTPLSSSDAAPNLTLFPPPPSTPSSPGRSRHQLPETLFSSSSGEFRAVSFLTVLPCLPLEQ